MVSQTGQQSTNSWNNVPCALTQPNPGYGQSDQTAVQQLGMVSQAGQKSTNPWIIWAFGHGMVDFVLSLTEHIQG
jgi:hypothetical protein